MSVRAPHFLLLSQAQVAGGDRVLAGRWRFELRTPDGAASLAAEDDEPETSAERLELLAIVRGLEALDKPSRVTLVSAGRSISRGLRYGLAQWRESDWQWERFGQLTPVKNGDLWQRIDRAMAFHEVEWRESAAATDDLAAPPQPAADEAPVRVVQHRGRRLRIDKPHKKHEIRGTKVETSSKHKRRNLSNGRRREQWLLRAMKWSRISDLVLRTWRLARTASR